MIIDVHTHYVPVAYLDYVRSHGASIGRELITVSSGETTSKIMSARFLSSAAFTTKS